MIELRFNRQQHTADLVFDCDPNYEKIYETISISLPIMPRLIEQGAKYILEGHTKGKRILFTGLRPLDGCYIGDCKIKSKKYRLRLWIASDMSQVAIRLDQPVRTKRRRHKPRIAR